MVLRVLKRVIGLLVLSASPHPVFLCPTKQQTKHHIWYGARGAKACWSWKVNAHSLIYLRSMPAVEKKYRSSQALTDNLPTSDLCDNVYVTLLPGKSLNDR